ncbi:MAG: hypothetical protein E6J34_03725 [Chloroflexi bacterium]|nr:MAG: hypothetical protein E6J34_03725 [Chloroflexota bacterium]
MLKQLGAKRMTVLAIISIVLVIVVAGVGLLVSGTLNQKQVNGTPTPGGVASATPNNGAASPLVFGTNLSLYDTHDLTISSQKAQQLMQKIHVSIVRMPTRSKVDEGVLTAAAQMIKTINATPLIILNGLRNANYVAYDTHIVSLMNQIFGDGIVYYEFGNEDDFNGVTMERYIQGWNSLIPALKKLAPQAHFVGPVSYQYSRKNLTTFLQGANPQPDEISWHEYTCPYKATADKCLASIDKWTVHINDARSAMQATINKELPIMITEWNYCPDQSIQANGLAIADGKIDNTDFMTQWTTKAIQTLVADHVFASMQYAVTNTPIPMITQDNTVTTQGTAFQAMYERVIGK